MAFLSDHQYGFRTKRSTTHGTTELIDKVIKAIESNEYTIGIFLDLSKAFDTVNHSILLRKLYFFGIRGNCHKWLKNFLTNRKQIVKYYQIRSAVMPITCTTGIGSWTCTFSNIHP